MKLNFFCSSNDDDDDDDCDYDDDAVAEFFSTMTNNLLRWLHSWVTPCQSFCHGKWKKIDVAWTDVE